MTSDQPQLPMAELRRRANQATVGEAVEILGVSHTVLRRMVQDGEVSTRLRPRPAHIKSGPPLVIVDLEQVEDAWERRRRLPPLARLRRPKRGEQMLAMLERGDSIEFIAREFRIKVRSAQKTIQRQQKLKQQKEQA